MLELIAIAILATDFQQVNPATRTSSAFDTLVIETVSAVSNHFDCLSRFLDYPPGLGKLGFPRCLFESSFPQNGGFWLRDMDFSCASPWNDNFGRMRAGTAISRRHIIFARHFPLAPKTRIAFVGVTGEVSHYSIKAVKSIDGSDIAVGALDYELTPDVHPAKVLPQDYAKWLPVGSRWPVITLTQDERTNLTELESRRDKRTGRLYLNNRIPHDENWRKLPHEVRSGDSGNPAFLLYKGELILLYCLINGGVGSGPFVHERHVKVQNLMDELCPGYKLEAFDFQRQGKTAK